MWLEVGARGFEPPTSRTRSRPGRERGAGSWVAWGGSVGLEVVELAGDGGHELIRRAGDVLMLIFSLYRFCVG